MADDKLVTIATFNYAAEAYLHRAKLESEGIWSFVADEFAPNFFITAAAGGVKLQVRESDAAEAIRILRETVGD
ncbi:MAG: DUF2007 domain-containing protein [Dehalococcoidales bacterium]|nr:DUF2007 domain-containing protein [Dehalococcoidales bacterium]